MTTPTSPILVAPRPVRLAAAPVRALQVGKRMYTSPSDLLDRLALSRSPPTDSENRERSPSCTARDTSPFRPGFASEALEEFLSILKPSMLNPPAGLFGSVRCTNHPTFPFERPTHRFSPRLLGDISNSPESLSPRPDARISAPGPLASPVSRTHTRNPFQRHPSYEVPSTFNGVGSPNFLANPTPASPTRARVSPRTVPLPSPTIDEEYMTML